MRAFALLFYFIRASLKRRLAQGHLAMSPPPLVPALPSSLSTLVVCENKWQSKENVFFMCAKGSRRTRTTTIKATTGTLLAFTKRGRSVAKRAAGGGGANQKPFGHSPLKRQLKISARQHRKRAQQIRNLLLFSSGTHLAVSLSPSHSLAGCAFAACDALHCAGTYKLYNNSW